MRNRSFTIPSKPPMERLFSTQPERRNLLTETLQQTDDLTENLSGGQANEVTDLTLADPNEGFAEVVSRKNHRSSTPNTSASGVQTRTQLATKAIGGQISLSSIGLKQPVTPEVLAMAVQLVKSMQDEAVTGQRQAKALARQEIESNEDSSYKRGQSRDRHPSRDRIRSNEGRRYPSRDRNQQWSDSKSRSKENWSQRSQSRGQDSRSSRDRPNADRSYSRDPPQSYKRTESRSPARGTGSAFYSNESRPSRSTDSRGRYSRTSSQEIRSICRRMDRGVNCRSDYDPSREKSCTKCTTPRHHEFECDTYYRYTSKKCSACKKCNHFADKCMEVERFPPNPGDGRSMELGKN